MNSTPSNAEIMEVIKDYAWTYDFGCPSCGVFRVQKKDLDKRIICPFCRRQIVMIPDGTVMVYDEK